MRKAWVWIAGVLAALFIVGLLFAGGSSRQAYRTARGAINARTQLAQDRIDLAVQVASQSVDMALLQAGNLPSQQAAADLIKQDIQEIGNRLKTVAGVRGDIAITRMDAVIEQYNVTLNAVSDASQKAQDPAVKSTLDKIYGILASAKNQLIHMITGSRT